MRSQNGFVSLLRKQNKKVRGSQVLKVVLLLNPCKSNVKQNSTYISIYSEDSYYFDSFRDSNK